MMKKLLAFLLFLPALAIAQSAPVLTSITAVHVDARLRQVPTATAPTLTVPKGTDATIALTVRNSDNTRTTITSAAITLTVRKTLADAAPVISRLATITDAANGLATFALAQSDTLDLATGDYLYSIEAVWLGGAREQLVKVSPFKVVAAVGSPSDTPTTPTPSAVVGYGLPAINASAVNKYLKVTDDDPATLAWASGGGGGGGISSLTCSAPISCGADLSDVTISHAASGITAATYGSASSVPVCSYNATGHATSCSSTAIALAASAITSGTLPVARGGTNATAGGSLGSVACWGSGSAYAFTAAPASTNSILHGNPSGTGIATWSAVDLASADVTGVLSVANGGTGSGTRNYVMLTGDETVAGVKTFSSVPRSQGIRSTSTTEGFSLYYNVTDLGGTGGYETPVGINFVHEQPLTETGADLAILVPSQNLGSGHAYARTFGVIHLQGNPVLEFNDPSENYLGALATRWDGGSPALEFRASRKIIPEYNADDSIGASPVYAGHHYGTVFGSNTWPGELDGARLWRSVGAFVFDTASYDLTCTGSVTYNPIRQGSAATCTSSGNVTSFTIADPDDGTGRTIDGYTVAIRLKQGNAGHSWPSTITNGTLPGGVSTIKPTLTLGSIDTLVCTYFAADSNYHCSILPETQLWQGLDSDLTALAGNSTSGLWAAGANAARTLVCSNSECTWTNGNGASGNPSLAITYGTTAHTACQGNDSRLPPSPGAAGTMLWSNGSAYQTVAAGSAGQCLLSNGTSAPSFGACSSGSSIDTLTIGTGLDGTSYNGSAPVTISLASGACAANLGSAAVTVAKGGTGLATLTAHSLYVGNGTSAPTALGSATNGQIPIGSTGADPVLATLTNGGGITATSGAGSITLGSSCGGDLSGSVASATVAKINGVSLGTVTATSGRFLVADGSAWQSVAMSNDATLASTGAVTLASKGSAGSCGGATSSCALTFDAQGRETARSDTAIALAGSAITSGTIAAARGGTGLDTSASTGIARVSSGTWSILAILTAALGGTGIDTSASTGVPTIATGTWSVLAQLSVALGGTGRATLTNHGVLVGAGTSAITQLAAAAAGTLLAGQGASSDPAFSATPVLGVAGTTLGTLGLAGNTSGTVTIQPSAAAGTYNFNLPTSAGSSGQPLLSGGGGSTPMSYGTLGVTGGGTGLSSCTTGDVNYCSSSNTVSALALGSAGRALVVNPGATAPQWGRFVDMYKSCTSATTGGANQDCAFDVLPSGLGSSNTKSFRASITCRVTSSGSGGGTTAMTVGTSAGGNDVLLSQTLTAGTTTAGTIYGDKSDGSELGTKADSTRGYNLYLDGGSTITIRLAAPSGTISAAVVVQCFLSGVTL